MLISRITGAPADETFIQSMITDLGKKLDVYEQILSSSKYLAGDEVTLADLFHLPYCELLPVAGAKVFETRPNVKR